jgi:hypothetical protein
MKEKFNDTADPRTGYPWPWDEPYPSDPNYNPRTDRNRKKIKGDRRYNKVKPRVYEAELSARKNETIRFHIKFSKGSHMRISWMLDSDEQIPPPRILPKYAFANATNQNPHVMMETERCEIIDDPGDSDDTKATIEKQQWRAADGTKASATFVDTMTKTAADLCSFPFRYESVLYYACTYLNITGSDPVHLCATATDEDFNPITMGYCNVDLRCPIQLPRPEEVGISSKEALETTVQEGEIVFNGTFTKAVETEIIIDRKFDVAGHTYNLTMVSYNMHDITYPNIVMKWRINCESPVKPEDWELVYNRTGIHFGETFEINFQVKPGVDLPTRPKIRVYAVTSLPDDPTVFALPGQEVTPATAMRRWDHAPFISHQTPDYTIPFYVKGEISKVNQKALKATALWQNQNRVRKYWWEPIRDPNEPDNSPTPPEMLMYDEYEMTHLGVETEGEDLGTEAHDGTSNTTNLKSPASGDPVMIGSGVGEADYTNFTLCFPTIKYPGSYAFTVTMWTGISDIRFASDRNLSNPVYYSENITLLLPGGEGFTHGSGKAVDYCLQFKNGTKLRDYKTYEELCQAGDSLELEVDPGTFTSTEFPWTPPGELNFNGSYKWMLNWVEIFEKLEGPNEGELKYVLPLEAPNDKVTRRC